MDTRSLLLALILFVGHVFARPANVVFILIDNQRAWTLGFYGNPDIQTPHIDRRASRFLPGCSFAAGAGKWCITMPPRAERLTI